MIVQQWQISTADNVFFQACHARGLDKYSFAISVMKEWLEDWIKLTQNLSGNVLFHCFHFEYQQVEL